jgi:hypothetical protein
MDYGLYAPSYEETTSTYAQNSGQWRRMVRRFEAETGD